MKTFFSQLTHEAGRALKKNFLLESENVRANNG